MADLGAPIARPSFFVERMCLKKHTPRCTYHILQIYCLQMVCKQIFTLSIFHFYTFFKKLRHLFLEFIIQFVNGEISHLFVVKAFTGSS
jgi:hypothetical protein